MSDAKALSRPDTWFNRHFPGKNQKKADQAVAQAKVAAEQSQREYQQAFEPYAEAHWHEADSLSNDSATKKEILFEANRLLEKIRNIIDLLDTAKASGGPQILDHTFGQLPQSALSGKGELAFIAARVHELELFTNSELPIRVANAKICEGATEIHDAFLALSDGELWAESRVLDSRFSQRSAGKAHEQEGCQQGRGFRENYGQQGYGDEIGASRQTRVSRERDGAGDGIACRAEVTYPPCLPVRRTRSCAVSATGGNTFQ